MARPPSKLYEFRKTVKRHRIGFITAGSVMIALVIGLALATVAWVREREARERAVAAESRNEQLALEESEQRQQAEASERVAQEAREKAESRAYVLQLSRVGTLWQDAPGQAKALLEDPQVCPPERRDFCWHLLYHLLHPQRLTIDTGDASIKHLAITPSNAQIVSTDDDDLLSVWNLRDGSLAWFTTVGALPRIFDFTPEGDKVVYTDEDSIVFRDLATGTVLRRWRPDQQPPRGVRIGQQSGRVLFTTGDQLHLWEPSTDGVSSSPRSLGKATIKDFVVSPQERYVALAADGDNRVRLWSVPNLEEVASFDEQWHPHHLAFSESTDPLILSSVGWNARTRIYVRDIETLETIKRFRSQVMALHTQFDPTGKNLLVADRFGRLLRFSLTDDEAEGVVLGGHRTGDVFGLDYSPDGDLIASGDNHGMIHTWPADPQPYHTALRVHHGSREAHGLAWDAHGHGVYTAGIQPLLQYADARQWGTKPISITGEGEHGALAMALSPDQRLIAVGDTGGTVHVLEPTSHRPVRTLKFVGGRLAALAFSTDGATLAVAGRGDTIELYDTGSWQLKASIEKPFGFVWALAYSPDGRWLFAGGSGGDAPHVAFVWPLQPQLGEPQRLRGHAQDTRDAVFSRDGQTLVTANEDQTLIAWDVDTWEPRSRLHGHQDLIYAVALSPDDRTLASSDADGSIILWDLPTGTPLLTLSLPTAHMHAHHLEFNPQGDTLAALASDGTLVTWNARPPEGILVTREQTHAARSRYAEAHFEPDGPEMRHWLRTEGSLSE